MKKWKCEPSGSVLSVVAAALSLLPISTFADDNAWVYDTHAHVYPVPAAAEGTLAELDTDVHGFGDAEPGTVDKWCWSWCFSEVFPLKLGKSDTVIFFR